MLVRQLSHVNQLAVNHRVVIRSTDGNEDQKYESNFIRRTQAEQETYMHVGKI